MSGKRECGQFASWASVSDSESKKASRKADDPRTKKNEWRNLYSSRSNENQGQAKDKPR